MIQDIIYTNGSLAALFFTAGFISTGQMRGGALMAAPMAGNAVASVATRYFKRPEKESIIVIESVYTILVIGVSPFLNKRCMYINSIAYLIFSLTSLNTLVDE